MRPRLLLLALLVLLVAPSAATARTSYCSPSGDYCESTYRAHGVRHITLRTFANRGRVKLCVTPPRGRGGCHAFSLRLRGHGIYVVDVRWRRHFALRGRGLYIVSFSQPPSIYFPPISFRY